MKHYLLCQKCHFNIFLDIFKLYHILFISYLASRHTSSAGLSMSLSVLTAVIQAVACDRLPSFYPRNAGGRFGRQLLFQQLLFLDSENCILEYQDFSMPDPQRSRHIKKQVTLCGCRHVFMIKFSSLKQNYVLVICIFTVRNGTLHKLEFNVVTVFVLQCVVMFQGRFFAFLIVFFLLFLPL